MHLAPFLLTTTATVCLCVLLNSPVGQAPAFGKFLDPFNGCWQNAENEPDGSECTLQLKGLKAPASVYFDQRNVPHVYAENEEDLYYLQGYITAKFRLWQMEIQTHNAAGRISEIVGKKALGNDRLQRRIGLQYGAENSASHIADDSLSSKLIAAYCQGVNAYIKNLTPKEYPLEYKLLGYAPEPWTPLKTALLLKNMANMLSVYEYDIENTNFISKYGEEAFHYLYPEKDAFTDFVIPQGTTWNFDVQKIVREKTHIYDGEIKDKREAFRHILEKPCHLNGSNNWAVAGAKTVSGKPILCNDPHLQLNLPSIWYEMHLVSPTMNVYGATLPGAPCVISGFNRDISWGVTNGGRDVRDWFRITFKDDTHNEYLVDGAWVKTEKRIERIKQKGGAEFYDTVLYTRYGPVVFDHSFGEVKYKKMLALKWTAHQGSNEFMTFYKLNRGKNYEDYIDALSHYTCPTQNFVFAARSGDIAIKQQGSHPLTHATVADGSLSQNDWHQYIPEVHNPLVKNPKRNFVSSANQFPVDETYPYPITRVGIYEESRAIRINRLLEDTHKMDAAYMMKMQNDNYNVYASLMLPTMLRILRKAGFKNYVKEIETLEKWDYYNNPESEGAVYFEAWANEVVEKLWDEMADPSLPMKQPDWYRTAYFLQQDSTSTFYDNLQTGERETRESLLVKCFDVAMYKLKQENKTTQWGAYKATEITHLAKIPAFSIHNVLNGGNRGIVNATNSTHGPSWRMIVDWGNERAYCSIPGGESGNPGSRFYDDMVTRWAKGEYYEVKLYSRQEMANANRMKWIVKP